MAGLWRMAGALALSAVVWTGPAYAESDVPPVTAKATDAAVAAALERGNLLYAYDQAAWHSTDALLAEIDTAKHPELRGYVSEPGEDGALNVTFYGERTNGLFAFARYTVLGSKVIKGGRLSQDADTSLSQNALRMIAARDTAIKAMQERKWGFCNRNQPNLLVLPNGADGATSVYIMSSSTTEGLFPAGGHYRFDIAADGTLTSARPFTKSCLDVRSIDDKGNKAEMGFVTHSLDAQPTEIHVFISLTLKMPMMIGTANGQFWSIENGKIAPVTSVMVDTK